MIVVIFVLIYMKNLKGNDNEYDMLELDSEKIYASVRILIDPTCIDIYVYVLSCILLDFEWKC